jgi:hypothetical protein
MAGLRRPWATAVVVSLLLVNPVFYSFYANTALHPRFMYASLPELFVLGAAGVSVVLGLARRRSADAEPAAVPRWP